MKYLLAGIIALFAVASVDDARAADMPVKAPPPPDPVSAYNWTGWYVGGNVGYAWGTSNVVSTVVCPAPVGAFCTNVAPTDGADVAAATSSSPMKRAVGGGQLGYNWQAANLVLGLEADFDFLNLNSSLGVINRTFPTGAFTYSAGASVNNDWLIMLRARLGVPLQNKLLAYVTGGLAIADVKVGDTFSTAVQGGTVGGSSTNSTPVGWTLGGGLEWAISNNWTVKGEYLYVDLNSVSTNGLTSSPNIPGTNPTAFGTSANLKLNIARGGINYKFN